MSETLSRVWLQTLEKILKFGVRKTPRGFNTKEIPGHQIVVNARHPVLLVPARKLSYRFMAAEAYWILSGDDKVSGIAPYNARIAAYSDDGEQFFGAYGPKIMGQMDYVIGKLLTDPDTRQACLTIWRENPPPTKDYPCTIAMVFSMRAIPHSMVRAVDAHVFMRSSDAWLGLPYDVFNFSMILHYVCSRLCVKGIFAEPHDVYLTMASSHLYEQHYDDAWEILTTQLDRAPDKATPSVLFTTPDRLMARLECLRDSKPGSSYRWWE